MPRYKRDCNPTFNTMIKHSFKLLIATVSIATASQALAEKVNCQTLSNTVKISVAANKSRVLELVSTYIGQNESCACEVVKAAIVASDANANLVADITEAAIIASPNQIELIGQCAVAVAPDAYNQVQAVVNKYSGGSDTTYNSSDYSSKGGSDEKDAVAGDRAFDNTQPRQDPLNHPGVNGPGFGGSGVPGNGFVGRPSSGGLNPFVPQPPIVNIPSASDEGN